MVREGGAMLSRRTAERARESEAWGQAGPEAARCKAYLSRRVAPHAPTIALNGWSAATQCCRDAGTKEQPLHSVPILRWHQPVLLVHDPPRYMHYA